MCSGLEEVVGRTLQLFHHGGHEVVKGAEQRLDSGVAEGQVGQCHDGVAAHLGAGGVHPLARQPAVHAPLHQDQFRQGLDASQERDGLSVTLVEGASREHGHGLLDLDGQGEGAVGAAHAGVAAAQVHEVVARHRNSYGVYKCKKITKNVTFNV